MAEVYVKSQEMKVERRDHTPLAFRVQSLSLVWHSRLFMPENFQTEMLPSYTDEDTPKAPHEL